MRALLVTVFALLLAAPASADVYTWTDDTGRTHFDDDATNVPEAQRDAARVVRTKVPPPDESPSDAKGPTQAMYSAALARELGLQTSGAQDPVSLLHLVGIYPSMGWYPSAPLTPGIVQEVVTATRAAARARRLAQPEGSAEAAALRAASGLGIATPPPAVPPEREASPQIVVAPNIVVETPPQQTVVVNNVYPVPQPVLSDYPTFAFGVPFAPIGPVPFGPIPERIVPLSNPAGRLHGPLITPLRAGPFQRPSGR